ncbi:MAG TPA: two-component regulator propeller domain-containing protein [Candidatus Eisenbacteria bacterium]
MRIVPGFRVVTKVVVFAIAASAWFSSGGTGTGAAKTSLFVKNYVNSNEIQGIVSWRGLLAMGTLGGIVTIDPGTLATTKILRSPGGLPSNHILSVEVSPSGMLWAGTAESGIARLRPDGTFRRTLSSFDGLPGDRVQAIYARADTVWVGTSAGVALFTESPATGQISLARAYTNASTSGTLAGDDVRAFLQVGDTLWVATMSGLSVFASGAWQNRAAALSTPATAFAFYADTLWAATPLGPYQYVAGAFRAANAGHAFASQTLGTSAQGFLSGAATFGVFRYQAGVWTPLSTGLPSLRVVALRDGPDGALWAGTLGGAARFRPSSLSWEPHRSDGPLVNGTQRAVADSRGVWFSTGNDFPQGSSRGVVLRFDGAAWSAITSATTGGAFAEADAFAILSARDSKLWFGHCCADANPRPRVDRFDPVSGLWDTPPAYNIWAMDQSPSGPVYAASVELENGVYVFDAASGALLDSLTPGNSGITSNNLRAVRFDSAGKGWFGTAFNGVDVWDGRGTLDHADDLWVHHNVQPSSQVSSLAVMSPETAWIGTSAGAGRIENGIFTRVLTTFGSPGLPSGQVNDLALDSNGNLWIATSGGLVRADASGAGAIEVFTSKDGLVDDDIRALVWDAPRGALWVGTTHGISRTVPRSAGEPGITDATYVYPNPSRSASLKLGGIQNVLEGEIRDLSGTVIHRFRCDPASNEIWNLRKENGEPAPSGVYLVVLHDKNGSKTLRAAVVR